MAARRKMSKRRRRRGRRRRRRGRRRGRKRRRSHKLEVIFPLFFFSVYPRPEKAGGGMTIIFIFILSSQPTFIPFFLLFVFAFFLDCSFATVTADNAPPY